jgi:hypothetical protein
VISTHPWWYPGATVQLKIGRVQIWKKSKEKWMAF